MEEGQDQIPLVVELTSCLEYAKRLQNSLDQSSNAIVQTILDSIEKSISIARQLQMVDTALAGTWPPRSPCESPVSGNSDQVFRDQERREITKKRKALPKWTNQIHVGLGAGLEGNLEDEYSWRKYGQKDILGAKYPRAYYRCTHQRTQGCLAMKQVQKSDVNPSIVEVTYRGEHTCIQGSQVVPPTSAMLQGEVQHQVSDTSLLHNYRTDLRVKTENLDNHDPSSTFSFPSTSIDATKTTQNHIFSLEHNHSFVGGGSSNFSPFISPETSESNYFPAPLFLTGGGFGGLHGSESDLTEILSATTSTTNSSSVAFDFLQEHTQFNEDFPFHSTYFI